MRALIFLSLIACLAGCVSPPPPQGVIATPKFQSESELRAQAGMQVSATTEKSYRINIGDELELRFPDMPTMNDSIRVRTDGKIVLPLVGALQAEGLPPEQLEAELATRYAALGQGGAGVGSAKKYLIVPNDELEIRFTNQPALAQMVRVRPDGKISLAMVKTVVAEGKSPEELESELTDRYREFLKKPDLVVIVKNATSALVSMGGKVVRAGMEKARPFVIVKSYTPPQIYVGGEVGRPGVLAYRSPLTLQQAVIEAGGNKPSGEMRSVIVMRKVGVDSPLLIRRNLSTDQSDGSNNDILLQPSDIVIVPKTSVATAAELIDQHIYQLFPVFRNSAFSFAYNLTPVTTIQSK